MSLLKFLPSNPGRKQYEEFESSHTPCNSAGGRRGEICCFYCDSRPFRNPYFSALGDPRIKTTSLVEFRYRNSKHRRSWLISKFDHQRLEYTIYPERQNLFQLALLPHSQILTKLSKKKTLRGVFEGQLSSQWIWNLLFVYFAGVQIVYNYDPLNCAVHTFHFFMR